MVSSKTEFGVFITNLPPDVSFKELKNLFEQQANIEGGGYTDILRYNTELLDAAVARFRTSEEQERAVSLNGFMWNGKNLSIQADADNSHYQRYCQMRNIETHFDNHNRIHITYPGRKPGLPRDPSRRRGEAPPKDSDVEFGVFLGNLSYKCNFKDLKDFFQDEAQIERGGFTDILTDPTHSSSDRSLGAGVARFRSTEELQRALACNGKTILGRKIEISHDPQNTHVIEFCKSKGHETYIDRQGRAQILRSEPSGKPRKEFQPRERLISQYETVMGGTRFPLVEVIPNFLYTTVEYSNFRWSMAIEDIKRLFMPAGYIVNITLDTKEISGEEKSDGAGLIEFRRSRDARRACLMFNSTDQGGRMVKVRLSKKHERDTPIGLAELGRPSSEHQCADMCTANRTDPFHPAKIFVSGIAYGTGEKELKSAISFVGDLQSSRSIEIMKTRERDSICATVMMATGIDAYQVIQVLDGCSHKGRKISVRMDRDNAANTFPPPGTQMPPQAMVPMGQPQPSWGQPPTWQQPPQSAPAPSTYGGLNLKGNYQQPNWGPTLQPTQMMQPHPAPVMQQQPMVQPMVQNQPMAQPQHMAQQMVEPQAHMQSHNPQPRRDTPVQPDQGPDNSDMARIARLLGVKASTLEKLQQLESAGNQQRSGRERSPVRAEVKNDSGWECTVNETACDTIYLRNLPPNMKESRLRQRIGTFGNIDFIDFPVNPDGSAQGYAYVRFGTKDNSAACREVVKVLNNSIVESYRLEVGLYQG